VLRLVLGQSAVLVSAGLVAGVALAIALSRSSARCSSGAA
jgi:hypothetical protein